MLSKIYSEVSDVCYLDKVAENKSEIERDFKARFQFLDTKLELVSSVLSKTIEMEQAYLIHIWNALGYVNTCSFDIYVAGEALIFETDKWKQRYFARQGSLNIYEASHDLPNMFGKEFRNSFNHISGGGCFLSDVSVTIKKINSFKMQHAIWLKDIRLNMAAHRDQSLKKQLNVVFNLDPIEVVKIMFEFDSILRELEEKLFEGSHLKW